MTNAIAVDGLSVRYGEVAALDDVHLQLRSGRVCALIGMNGSGKSTLLKALVGLVRPSNGTVLIEGETPARARRRGAVAYVPQSEDVDWRFPVSVRDVVMMGRYGHQGFTRHPRPADRSAVTEAIARVDLTDLADRQIGRLSGGQRKRAFVARGIAQDAAVLLLDEPFAGVDQRSQGTIARLLRDLAAEGRTVFVTTHDLAGVTALADEAVLLQRRVLAHGTPAEVLTPENLGRAFGLGSDAA